MNEILIGMILILYNYDLIHIILINNCHIINHKYNVIILFLTILLVLSVFCSCFFLCSPVGDYKATVGSRVHDKLVNI